MTTTTRNYYAAKHTYGVEFGNDFDTLYRFESKSERDEFVDREQNRELASFNGNMKTDDITSAAARRHFPDAFRPVDDPDWDWISHADGRLSYDVWPYRSATYFN